MPTAQSSTKPTKVDHGDYRCHLELNGKTIYFRKWRVKDRIALESAQGQSEVRQVLVYNCLEDKDIVLDDYEYQYVLIKLREASVGDEIKYNFVCNHCRAKFDYTAKISETMEPIHATYEPIVVDGYRIELGEVSNRGAYESVIFGIKDITERKIADMVMHIRAINGNMKLGYKDLMNLITEMDVDVFQEIWNQWNQVHFRLNRIHRVECPFCKKTMLIEFDDMPGFFPEKWNMQ